MVLFRSILILLNFFFEFTKKRHFNNRILANEFYQDLINDKRHLHMNSSKWLSLTNFVKFLCKKGICMVDLNPKGMYITNRVIKYSSEFKTNEVNVIKYYHFKKKFDLRYLKSKKYALISYIIRIITFEFLLSIYIFIFILFLTLWTFYKIKIPGIYFILLTLFFFETIKNLVKYISLLKNSSIYFILDKKLKIVLLNNIKVLFLLIFLINSLCEYKIGSKIEIYRIPFNLNSYIFFLDKSKAANLVYNSFVQKIILF